jgi:hypothetical protein
MSNDKIIFEKDDTFNETLTKIVYLNSGSHTLKKELDKLNVRYTKVEKGLKTSYILRGAKIIDKLVVTL